MRGRSRWMWRAVSVGGVAILAALGLLVSGLTSSRGAQRPRAVSTAPIASASPMSRAASVAPGSPAASVSPGCSDGAESLYSYGLPDGAKLVSQVDVALCVTGQVTVTFAGDPATGCHAHGLCDYRGTDTWKPAGIGDLGLLTDRQYGHRSTSATLSVGSFDTPVLSSVQRTGSGGTAAACSDRAITHGAFLTLPVHGEGVVVGLGDVENAVFGTRCAGPLSSDLAAAMPHRTVSLTRLRRGHLDIDLSGSTPFAAGGFSGTVVSTVKLALGHPHTQSGSQSVSSPPGSRPTRIESVRYVVRDLGGSAAATVSTSAAACGALDACGVSGTIAVSPRTGSSGSAFLTADSNTPHSARDLLTALGVDTGGDTAGISVEGAGEASPGGALTAALTQDGAACDDHLVLHQTDVLLREHAGRLIVSVAPGDTAAADPLRTRCPGPALDQHTFSSASLPLSILRDTSFTVKLHGASFVNGPYAVAVHSSLRIGLRRVRVISQTLPFRAR